MRETQREDRRTKEEKKNRKKKRKEKMEAFDLAYKRADSLLSPAQHPPDVFDSRYCGAHTHGQGGKMYKESVTVCARFTDRHRLLLDSACLDSALLRHRNHPL